MSFLSVFDTVLHAVEAAAAIAAPIIQTMDPEIGGLMSAATQAAIGVEQSITTPGSGQQKAQVVTQQTQAAIDVTNAILASQGKKPLPANTGQVIAAQVGVVVGNLNAIEQAVKASSKAPAPNSVSGGTGPAPAPVPPPPPAK